MLDTEELKALTKTEKNEQMTVFADLIEQEFGLNPRNYCSLANLGQAILEKTDCYRDVPALCGPPAGFIRLCQTPPLVQPRYDQPVMIEGRIQQLDKRGSYCSTYIGFQGIPRGQPCVMAEFEPSEWDYFYICVDVKKYESKLDNPFPLLRSLGRLYLDKVLFDAINERYDWEFDWVSGYGFNRGFNTRVCVVAGRMWGMRMMLKKKQSPLEGVVKRMINSLFGKAIARDKLTSKVTLCKASLVSYLSKAAKSKIFAFKKAEGDNYDVRFVNSIVVNWIRPQFGVNVLNWSRVMMQRRIDKAESLGCPVFYVNTDCLVMQEKDVLRFNAASHLIGGNLGDFQFELPSVATRFICISRRSYMFRLDNGGVKVRWGPKGEENPEEWFEQKYIERTSA
jgi:hypothetical protein